LQLYVCWPNYHHRGYHPADLFLAHLFAIVAGIGRIENAQSLIHNGLIPPLLGCGPTTWSWPFNFSACPKSAALEHLHPAPRALVVARRVGQTGQSQSLDAPGEIPSSGFVPQDSAGDIENQAVDLSQFAALLTARSLVGG
jgi:hypothetical protein